MAYGRRDGILDCGDSGVRKVWCGCTLVVLIITTILLSVSIKKLSSVEYGVEYDRWAKELDDAAKSGGLHVGPVGFRFIKFPSTQISAELADTCVSRDGLRVAFQVQFQYQMPVEYISDAVLKYRDYKNWATVVEVAGNSAVQHTCSDFNVTDFQNNRAAIQSAMLDTLKYKLQGGDGNGTVITDEGVYALANSLQLQNVDIPTQYKNAVSEKQRAQEDIVLASNQRQQELTKARTDLLAAKEEAVKILASAENSASVTLTKAGLKADETKFSFQKEKEVLEQAKENFNLDSNGILAYMSNQLYASVRRLEAHTGEPAKISRKDKLSITGDEL